MADKLTYEQAGRRIEDHFKEKWNGVTPIVYPNRKEDLGEVPMFGRMTIKPSRGRQVAVGGRMHRRTGVIFIQLFVEQGTGQNTIGALEEKATRIFTDHAIPDIRLYDVGANRIGHDGRGYYQSNVTANFDYDVA